MHLTWKERLARLGVSLNAYYQADQELKEYRKHHLFTSLPDPAGYAAWKRVNPGLSIENVDPKLIINWINQLGI